MEAADFNFHRVAERRNAQDEKFRISHKTHLEEFAFVSAMTGAVSDDPASLSGRQFADAACAATMTMPAVTAALPMALHLPASTAMTCAMRPGAATAPESQFQRTVVGRNICGMFHVSQHGYNLDKI